MRSNSIFAESLSLLLPNRVQPGTEGGRIKPSAPNRGTGLAGSGGEYPQQRGCLSLTGRRLEMGWVPGPQAPAAGSQPALPQGHTCAVSPGQPLRLSERVALDHLPQCLLPPQSICMRGPELPAGRGRSKGVSPFQCNLTPTSVFKDKNLCIKRPSDSEGTVWLIYFFLHIICLAFVETIKLFSFFRHETWPRKP